ncbi:hypothetical protein [Pontibacter mangrovi]|uniref:hypothetical protein n=1 Tax=Pontibacter mangrovi TaxID=2589816 RepID=UPI001EF1576F|nr:hypothetical protein [Pontibacter mangrovi]
MKFNTVLENDFVKVEVDPDKALVRNEWLRTVSHEEVVNTAAKLNDIIKSSRAEVLLLNAQKCCKLNPETKEWLVSSYYKSLSDTAVKRVARVLPDNVFNKLSFEAVLTRAEALGSVNFEVKNFSSDRDALLWLLS